MANILVYVIVLSSFFVNLTALAEESGELPDINVLFNLSLSEVLDIKISSATKHEQSLKDIPATVYIFTEQDFIRFGFRDLKDVLKYTSGVEYGYAHSWLQGGQRGFSGTWTHTRLLIDGRDADKVIRNQAHITHQYPLHNIKRVEIIQGPASSLYGADVFSGLINLVTKTHENSEAAQSYSVTLGSGEDELESKQVTYSNIYKTPGWGLSFHASLLDLKDPDYTDYVLSDQYSKLNTDLRQSYFDSGNPYEDDNKGYDISLTWNYHLASDGVIEMGIDKRGSRDGGGIENPELIYTNFKETLDQTRVFLKYVKDEFIGGELSMDYQFLREDMIYDFNWRNLDNGDPPPLVQFAQEDSELQNLAIQYDVSFDDYHNYLIVGLNYKDMVEAVPVFGTKDYSSRIPFYSHQLSSVFIQDQQTLLEGKVFLTIGLRHDESNLYDNVDTMRGAVQYNFNKQYSTKVLYGQAFREPTSSELSKNDELDPADIETTELVLDASPNKYVSYKFVFYASRARNIIGENRQDTDGPIINVDKKEVDGFESSLRWHKGKYSGFAWVNYTNTESQLDLAEYKLGLGVSRELTGHWILSVVAKYTDEITTEAIDENSVISVITVPEYRLVDLTLVGNKLIDWQYGGVDFSASIYNLFDQKNYYSNPRGPDPIQFLAQERSYFLQASFSF